MKDEITKCSVSWCTGTAIALGYCKPHYRRFRRTGLAADLGSPDVDGLIAVLRLMLIEFERIAVRLHGISKHKQPFETCTSGECVTFKSLVQYLDSAESKGDVT